MSVLPSRLKSPAAIERPSQNGGHMSAKENSSGRSMPMRQASTRVKGFSPAGERGANGWR